MRLSDLLSEIRIALDSVTSGKWSSSQMVAAANVQLQSMVRRMTENDEAWHSHVFVILGTSARAINSDRFAYRMPPWVMKLSQVRQYLGGTGNNKGPVLNRVSKFGGHGWIHSAINEIQLVGWSTAIDLEFHVAKLPARLTKGTLGSQAGVAANQLLMDPDGAAGDATDFPHESTVDAYAGALFEITGPASNRKGQLLRAIASTPNQGGGTNQHLLTFEANWTVAPASSDTYEMHAELPGEHSRYLVLLVARHLLSQQRNVEGVRIYAQELREQEMAFVNMTKARDVQQRHFVQEGLPVLGGQESFDRWPYQVET